MCPELQLYEERFIIAKDSVEAQKRQQRQSFYTQFPFSFPIFHPSIVRC